MELEELFEKQRKLDAYILQNKSKSMSTREVKVDTTLAAIVECTELQQTDYDKYNDKLFEYIDVLHFILSLHNQYSIKSVYTHTFADVYRNCADKVLETVLESRGIAYLIQSICNFAQASRDFKHWSIKPGAEQAELNRLWDIILEDFCVLGHAENFVSVEIERAYLEKNKVNYKRQEDGY